MPVFADLVQWCYPKAFRITSSDVTYARRSEDVLTSALISRAVHASGDIGHTSVDARIDRELLIDLCVTVWSARKRMLVPGSDAPETEYRRLFVPIREAWTKLADRGIEIIDHDGQPYDPGLSLEVRSIQPSPGLTEETVIRTVKPTIHWGDQRLQMGVVEIGAPIPQLDDHTNAGPSESAV
jgi:hypothetical protein